MLLYFKITIDFFNNQKLIESQILLLNKKILTVESPFIKPNELECTFWILYHNSYINSYILFLIYNS